MNFNYPKIGIIGLGFVGSAIHQSIDVFNPVCVDADPRKGHTGTYQEIIDCEGIFICVPSPMNSDNTCDTSILESVLEKLVDYQGVIISKVTAPPDTYERLNSIYPNLVHSPEFLTAANAVSDYNNASWTIIGGNVRAYRTEAERIISLTQPNLKTFRHCKIGEAALTKYAINTFLATKVVFMNELYQLAERAGLDYRTIAGNIYHDPRIGTSHMNVPGHDGGLGFGGYCFPKDTEAFLKYAESQGTGLNVLESAVKKNTLLRLTLPK